MFQLMFPVGCASAQTVDEHHGLLRIVRTGINHAHFQHAAICQAIGQLDGVAMQINVKSHGGIVFNFSWQSMCQ